MRPPRPWWAFRCSCRALWGQFETLAGEYLQAEEASQTALLLRESFDSKAFAARWERYRGPLTKALINTIGSSYGNRYHDIFWIHHSLFVARYLKGIPKRILHRDSALGREHGDEIKYRIYQKWIDRVVSLTYDVAHRLAAELHEKEDALFPDCLGLMRDNVLILTEDYISADLSELQSYFQGCLKIDGRELRSRFTKLTSWHSKIWRKDASVRSVGQSLLGVDGEDDPNRLLFATGYLSYLSQHASYNRLEFPFDEQITLLESLFNKLKEYEVLNALRKMIVPVEVEGESLISRDRSINMTWIGGPPELRLSSSTRPMDFFSHWIVDPLVHRFGMVYDISDFSATITLLGKSQKTAMADAFRHTYTFQRKVNTLALDRDLKFEKYLGDGAFFSSHQARHMLPVAIGIQRLYSAAIKSGLPFDRGLRIALNFGEYRLLPLEGEPGEKPKYEYFGHGLVELSRLTTGKKTQEIDELKNYLVAQGYPETAVTKFFEPMMRKNSDLVNKDAQERQFYAYINPNGTMINEGIVATENYIRRLGTFPEIFYARQGGRGYVVVPFVDGKEQMLAGLRKLGMGKFKGLEEMPIFEIIDGAEWVGTDMRPIPTQNLLAALERVFASARIKQ